MKTENIHKVTGVARRGKTEGGGNFWNGEMRRKRRSTYFHAKAATTDDRPAAGGMMRMQRKLGRSSSSKIVERGMKKRESKYFKTPLSLSLSLSHAHTHKRTLVKSEKASCVLLIRSHVGAHTHARTHTHTRKNGCFFLNIFRYCKYVVCVGYSYAPQFIAALVMTITIYQRIIDVKFDKSFHVPMLLSLL
jgi:hypothetical protein